MPQPDLTSPRLLLTPLTAEHLEFEIELDSDPEVMRYLGPGGRTREETIARHAVRTAPAHTEVGLGFWVGLLDDEPVGWWLLTPSEDPAVSGVELGYRLLRRYWRQGLASEGSRALLEYAFTGLDSKISPNRVFATTMAVNQGSRAVMASIQLRHIRTYPYPLEPGEEALPGHEHGEVEYAITEEAWRSSQ